MTDLYTLLDEDAADEFWLPDVGPDEIAHAAKNGKTICAYLFSRASYVINGLFEQIKMFDEVTTVRGVDYAEARLWRLAERVEHGNEMTPTRVAVLELVDGLSGFVGVPLKSEVIQRIVRQHLRSTAVEPRSRATRRTGRPRSQS